MSDTPITRRAILASLTAAVAALSVPTIARTKAKVRKKLPAKAKPRPKPRALAPVNPSKRAAALLDAIAWGLMDLSPEGATSLGLDKGVHRSLRSQLGDRSPAGQAKTVALLRRALSQIAALPEPAADAPLDAATQTSLAVVNSAFATALDGFALPYGDVAVGGWRNTPYVVIQNVGAYIDTPRFLDGDHPVKTQSDAEAYLARLSQMPAQLDGELARMRSASALGLVPPDFLLEKTILQMERTIADAGAGSSSMATSLVKRTAAIPGKWGQWAQETVSNAVVPALQRQLDELKLQRGMAKSEAGMWARPRGDEWYAWALRASTTTRHSPAEIHQIGKEQLAELQARMEPILRKLGYTSGTVGARMKALGEDPRFQFPKGDEGRRQIIALMEQKIAFIRTRLPDAFRTLVPGKLEIRRLPIAEEAGAPNAYGGAGSIDGTIPGKIWLNLGETSRHNRFSVPDLGFHEGIPGHVWQGEYANRLPLIRSILAFNAYSEGWALYAQQLADELGAYDDDPVGRLGYLQGIAFRCCRLVVDTGLHAMRWSRGEAQRWFAEANGSGIAELAPEIDRYCSWPGQACGYKMGQSEINAQRQRAKAALGAKYDLRDFDQAVVGGGNVPLDVLGINVGRYIDDVAGSPGDRPGQRPG